AIAMRRDGFGSAKGTGTTSLLWYFGMSALLGKTEMPRPEATMFRTVSSELLRVSSAPGLLSSGHVSSTWLRKQLPTLSRMQFSAESSFGSIAVRCAHGCE